MPRITGKIGTVAIDGGAVVADLFNWAMDITVEAVPCPIKAEKGNTVSVGGTDVRVTVERFSTNAAGDSLLAESAMNLANSAGNATGGTAVEYVLRQIAGGLTGATVTGSGVIARGSLNAPRGLANDTMEITGTTVPVIT